MTEFIGFFDVDQTMAAAVSIEDASNHPVDPTTAPSYRVYDGTALLATGVLSQLDTGVITGASNAAPIVITSTAHGLQTGNVVKVSNVGGNSAANVEAIVTRLSPDTFSLQQTTGNGAYTAGGTWHVLGLYQLSQSLVSSLGFESGKSYQVYISYFDGAADRIKLAAFGVL